MASDVAPQTEIGGNSRRDGKRRRNKMLLSEMFGVERDTDFGVEGLCGKFQVRNNGTFETLVVSDGKGEYDALVHNRILLSIIAGAPGNIIHLPPPLTDEQREQLRAIWTLGGRWLAKDASGDAYAYESKPEKREIYSHWNHENEYEKCFTVICELTVCALVSWSDPEPYDIGKALGVEG